MKRNTLGSLIGSIAFLVLLCGVILFGTAFNRTLTNGSYSHIAALSEGGDLDAPVNPSDNEAAIPEDASYEISDEDPNEVAGEDADEVIDKETGEDSDEATEDDSNANTETEAGLDEEEQSSDESDTESSEPVSEGTEEETAAAPSDAGEAEDEVIDVSNGSPSPNDIPGPRQYPPENNGDFYFAYFDVRTEGSVKAQVEGLILRFVGFVDSIDPTLLSDVVLTKDGVPVKTSLSLSGIKDQYQFGYTDITDFYFSFNDEITEPGTYGLTGNYNGEWFKVYNKVIESPVSDLPADPSDLRGAGWCFYPGIDGKPMRISELSFFFEGNQNTFYQEDLTDLVITLNGEAIPFSFMDRVFRYYEYNELSGSGDTSFNLVLNEAFTQSGTYVATGVYKGKSFTTMEITIP